MTWKLQAITGEFEGQEVAIEHDTLVGRHQEAGLVLKSAEISRRHAAFLLKDDVLWVQDLKSSNGTFVNDIRIDQDKMLMDGDIVQFASIKFSVLAPAKSTSQIAENTVLDVQSAPVIEKSIQQPLEAIATAETIHVEKVEPEPIVAEKSPAQKMNEQGMPELSARDTNVQLSRDGMPTQVGIPKPAPIPEGVNIHTPEKNEACDVKIPEVCSQEEVETQKNAKTGLITIITLVVLAILAWLFFK